MVPATAHAVPEPRKKKGEYIIMDMYCFKGCDYKTEIEETEGGRQKNVTMLTGEHESPFDAGIAEYSGEEDPAIFDHTEYGDVVYILEGEMCFESNIAHQTFHGYAGDMVYMVKKEGLKMKVWSPNYGKIFWASYPHCY